MSWVRPDREILPRSSTHITNTQLNNAVMVKVRGSIEHDRKCTHLVLNLGLVVCESITQSAHPLLLLYSFETNSCQISKWYIVDTFPTMSLEGSVTSLQFYSSGSHMFSSSEDGTVCIWKTGGWECSRILRGHKYDSIHIFYPFVDF